MFLFLLVARGALRYSPLGQVHADTDARRESNKLGESLTVATWPGIFVCPTNWVLNKFR